MPDAAAALAQLATGVGPVALVTHVVVVYALPELAVAGLQLPTGVGPVVDELQVVVV